MKIGSAWTRQSTKDGRTFISVVLDEAVQELFPQLKNCNISMSYIDPKDRKSEKSPGWVINLSARRDETKDSSAVEKAINSDAPSSSQSEGIISDEEIPF